MASRFYIETLGCPKNEVDSEKLVGTLLAQGLSATEDESQADVVVVNTCAFIEEARKESIDTILTLSERRKNGARLVVTGCMAERYGDELRANLPEADQIAGFGVAIETGVSITANAVTTTAVTLGRKPSLGITAQPVPSFDLLNLPRPASRTPWAYVKIAEGCDRILWGSVPSRRSGSNGVAILPRSCARCRRVAGQGNRARGPGSRLLRHRPPERARCRFDRRLVREVGSAGRSGATVVPVPERL